MFGYAFAEHPFGGIPIGSDASVPNPLRLLNADPSAKHIYLLVAAPHEVDEDTMTSEPVSVYLSDKGFKTEPTDTPANQDFPARLQTAYSFQTSLPIDGVMRGGAASFGTVRIANMDGKLDYLTALSWVGREIEIKVGGIYHPGLGDQKTLSYAEYGTLLRGTAAWITWTEQFIDISTRNPSERFAVPVQSRLYAGTGGIEGDAALKGVVVPIGYGFNEQVPARLIDSFNRVYQLNDGSIQAVLAVRDKGAPLGFDADYADYAALIAATIAPGDYATCLALGLIRLGAPSEGLVTVDFEGDDDGGYIDTAPAILRRIATTRGNAPLDDPAEVDVGAFTESPATQEVGIWIGDQRTIAEVLDELAASIGAAWDFNRAAQFTLTRLEEPGIPDLTIDMTGWELGSLQRLQTPEPVFRVRLGYRKFYAVQDPSSLVQPPNISEEDRDNYGKEYRFVVSDETEGDAVRALYPNARELVVLTLLADEAEAQAECDRLFDLLKVKRDAYQARDLRNLFQHRIGQTTRIKHKRFGLENGRAMREVHLADSSNSRASDLVFWG